jgi:cytoskeleton protein RodZ
MQDSSDTSPDEPSAPADRLADLGGRLRTARKNQELSLENIAAELRIEATVLDALEEGRFSQLGAPVFVRGYIKQYGRALGLDVAELLKSLESEMHAQEVEIRPRQTIHLRDERQITHWIVAALIVALVVVLLFVWWVSPLDTFSSVPSSSAPSSSVTVSEPPEAIYEPLPDTTLDDPIVERVAERPGDALVQQRPGAGLARSLAGDGAGTGPPPVAAGPEVGTASDFAAEPLEATGTGEADSTLALENGPLEPLRLEFREDSWTEITDARDQQLYYDLGRQGASAVVYGEPPFNVFLGNADGVRLTLGDEAVTIPPVSRRGNLANFVVHATSD